MVDSSQRISYRRAAKPLSIIGKVEHRVITGISLLRTLHSSISAANGLQHMSITLSDMK